MDLLCERGRHFVREGEIDTSAFSKGLCTSRSERIENCSSKFRRKCLWLTIAMCFSDLLTTVVTN